MFSIHVYFRRCSCWRRVVSLSTAPVRSLWRRTKNRWPGPFRPFPACPFGLRWEQQPQTHTGLSGIRSSHSVCSSGAPRGSRRHAGSWAVSSAAANAPEVPPRAELGPRQNRRLSNPQSRQGHHRLLYRQVPESLTKGVFSLSGASRRELACLNGAAGTLRWGAVDKRRSCLCLATAALWKVQAM